MESFLGYNDVFPLDKWVPLNVLLENKGKTMRGSLEAVVTTGSEYHKNVRSTTYAINVELPTNARKLYSFIIRLASFTHPLVLQLKDRGNIVLHRKLNLRNYYTKDRLVLVLSERVSLDFLSIFPEKFKPIYPRAEYLPETWYGYDGAEMVIINGSILKRLRKKQFSALKEWIKQGGYCIIAGNVNFSAYLDSRMRELLPVKVFGLKKLSALPSLETFCEERLIVSDPFLILESTPINGKVLVREGSLPVIVKRDIGLGKVLFLAFDHDMSPFSEWKGRFALWEKILALRITSDRVPPGFDRLNLLSSMLTKTSAQFPSHLLLIAFLAVYLTSFHYVFRLFKKNRMKRRRTLVYLAAFAIGYSLLSYIISYYQQIKRDPLINGYVHLNLVDKNWIASAKYFLGLYSLKGGSYQIDFDADKYPISPTTDKVAGKENPFDFELNETDGGQSIVVKMNRWSGRIFTVDVHLDFPLGGKALMDKQGLAVSIENLTSYTIRDCLIYFANRVFPAGNIMPDSIALKKMPEQIIEETKELTIEDIGGLFTKMTPGFPISSADRMGRDLMSEILKSIHSRYSSEREVALFLGRIDSGVFPTRLRGYNGHSKEIAMIELEMTVEHKEI